MCIHPLAAVARGDHALAAAGLGSVIGAWDRMGYVPEAALARQFAGESLLAIGTRDEAIVLLEAARASFARLGARRGLAETTATLARAAADAGSASPT
ncbi:MAG TPA: hypothetical protein VGK16_15530 [Candidatus Limnocylindrales bacterium]|jgi:hypothetical protein